VDNKDRAARRREMEKMLAMLGMPAEEISEMQWVYLPEGLAGLERGIYIPEDPANDPLAGPLPAPNEVASE
jgi:hypothetical protein